MAGLRVEIAPQGMPVSLADMKNYLKVPYLDDDALISMMISGATELVEAFTARSLINKGYVQTLDSPPYFTDTVMSQMAYPPSYYSLPRYSTTLWNYSQMIKLLVSPLVSVTNIAYLSSVDSQYHSLLPAPPPWYPNIAIAAGAQFEDGNGNLITAQNAGTSGFNPPTWATIIGNTTIDNPGPNQVVWLNGGPAQLNSLSVSGDAANTFFFDTVSEPPRIFPGPAGSFWPSVLYVPNAFQIHFVAGHGANSTIAKVPVPLIQAIHQLVAGWYGNREAFSPGNMKEMPYHIKMLLWSKRVLDMQPTRG